MKALARADLQELGWCVCKGGVEVEVEVEVVEEEAMSETVLVRT